MDIYEVAVIGGGPGGYLCAERTAQGGLKTILFEDQHMGGTCLNEGCVPTKALLQCAKMYRHATESEMFGVKAEGVTIDHAAAVAHKAKVVKTLVSGVEAQMRANKIKVVKARAAVKGKGAEGFMLEANGEEFCARRIVFATGSSTTVIPVPGLKEGLASGFVVTNKEILSLEKLPETMVIIGAGVIGIEMATYYAANGVKCVIVEMADKIAGAVDRDVSALLAKKLEKMGVEIKLSAKLTSVGTDRISCEKDGKNEEILCGCVLLAAGRTPNTKDIGLEKLGVSMNGKAIDTDTHMRTNVPGVYAIGDCNGKSMLAHTAYRGAEVAANDILGRKDEINYASIGSQIFSDPEVAIVGENVDSAKAKGINAKEVKVPLMYSGRYVAEQLSGEDFIKLIIDKDKNCIIGAQMIGPYASELISNLIIAVDSQMNIERLKKFLFPHPTVGEIIHEALFQIK